MKRMNNAGLTFVELICTIALLSIVGLAGMSMMVTVTRMNHTVALQQKQAREAEVVIETLRGYLQKQSTTYTPADQNNNNATIEVKNASNVVDRTITFVLREDDGKQNLVMTITMDGATPVERILANDIDPTNGFGISKDETSGAYTVTLLYANGNEFQWVLTPRV